MIKNIINLGDSAIYCDFGSEVNREINSQVINYFKNLQENKISGIINITPSYNKLIISFDLTQINYCLLYTSPSPRDGLLSRMPSSA